MFNIFVSKYLCPYDKILTIYIYFYRKAIIA